MLRVDDDDLSIGNIINRLTLRNFLLQIPGLALQPQTARARLAFSLKVHLQRASKRLWRLPLAPWRERWFQSSRVSISRRERLAAALRCHLLKCLLTGLPWPALARCYCWTASTRLPQARLTGTTPLLSALRWRAAS